MKKPIPKTVEFDLPLGPIEDTKFYDKDADDVIKHAEEEKKTEQEQLMMFENDPLRVALRERLEGQQLKFRRSLMMVLQCRCQVFGFCFLCVFSFCGFWFRLVFCVLLMRPGNAHWTMYRSAIALFCGPFTLTGMHGNLPISFRQVQTC